MNEKKIVIKPKTGWFDINLNEVLQYKDLIFMFVKRNFASTYKQTILGPLWFIINPLITTIMFTFIFGNIANISTEGVPQFLFFMAGNTIWSYFATCFTATADTFRTNESIFGKVYFPRLTMPLSIVIFSLISFFIQFIIFIIFIIYFLFIGDGLQLNTTILLTPIWILQLGLLGMGFGIIVSSLTTKYRDLSLLVGFGIQLWMYITPVVYPLSEVPERFQRLIMFNPISPIVINFRHAFLGTGTVEWKYWGISILTTMVVLFLGIIIFSKIEKTFMDTI